ncbi:MAG: FIST domain protein, partial [Chloroflexi bacterium]|nr:FIST domain protein [Chloroflexota bacterium]
MLQSSIAYSKAGDSTEAGSSVGSQISKALEGDVPDALIVFASPRYDHEKLLGAIDAACHPHILIGCSSAGEFTSQTQGVGLVCAVALRSPEMHFAAGIGHSLRSDRAGAAKDVISSFTGMSDNSYVYRCALVLTDALAGQVDDFVEQMTVLTGGTYQFFGGGAGDDDAFTCTHVFYGTQVITDAVVALEILSNKPIGVGVSHGWQPASAPMRVTESGKMRLVSVNAMPAAEIFEEHAEQTGQSFDRANPLPFFLHNVIGIR